MGKYAVIGDSYAVVDKAHSHWAKFWAEKHTHEIDFFGLEGGNLVNISYLAEHIDLDSYDGVIIHFTSLLRAEGCTYKDDQTLPIVIQMSDVYSDQSKDFFKYFLPDDGAILPKDFRESLPEGLELQYYSEENKYKFLSNFHNLMPHWFENFDLIDENTSQYDILMSKICNKFYSSTSIRWLVRANFMAYRNIILSLKEKSINSITVFPTCGGFEQTIAHIQNRYPDTKIWDQSKLVRIHPSSTESANHIDIDNAKILADEFKFI